MVELTKIKHLRYRVFLKDVFLLAISAFGGPQAHLSKFITKLVHDKKYISEEEYMELNSLCQLLPGPSSTQTITTIGFRLGGPKLAWLTLLVWVFPSALLMTLIALWVARADHHLIPETSIRFLPAMAVGFIIMAAIKLSQTMLKNYVHIIIALVSASLAITISYPLIFPLILILGGFISNFTSRKKGDKRYKLYDVRWPNFWLYTGTFITSALLAYITQSKLLLIFENTFRFGSIVFGGGNVLIPMMYNQFVLFKHYINHEQFITGVGFLQAIPGPVFSFSAYTGGMIFNQASVWMQMAGSFVGILAIFLPGIFLIFFIYPLWNQLKKMNRIMRAIEGINAASAGLAIAAAWFLFAPLTINLSTLFVIGVTCILIYINKIPSPIIVLVTILAGIFIP